MGFSSIDPQLTNIEDLRGAVILTKDNDRIELDGHMMFAGTFGFYESKSWYFLCSFNDQQDCFLERQNCDAGEGWFLHQGTDRRPENLSAFDDAVHKSIWAYNTAWKDRYFTGQKRVYPVSITPGDKPHCKEIQDIIDGKQIPWDSWIQ